MAGPGCAYVDIGLSGCFRVSAALNDPVMDRCHPSLLVEVADVHLALAVVQAVRRSHEGAFLLLAVKRMQFAAETLEEGDLPRIKPTGFLLR